MLIILDEDFALMVIRRQIERAYRLVVAPGRPLDEAAIDEWLVKASALLEQYALGVFCMAEAELIKDVALEVVQDIVRQTKKRDSQGVYSPSELKEMRLFNDVRKNLSALAKRLHNEGIGITRGRQAQVSVEKIIECLRKLPKSASLTRLASELNLPPRTIQHTLNAAGLTFKAAKKIANAQE